MTPTPDPLREVAQAFIDHVVAETKTHTGCPQRLALDAALAQPVPALDVERLQRIETAASILVSVVNVTMPEESRCGHSRDWLNDVLDDLRAALGDPA